MQTMTSRKNHKNTHESTLLLLETLLRERRKIAFGQCNIETLLLVFEMLGMKIGVCVCVSSVKMLIDNDGTLSELSA